MGERLIGVRCNDAQLMEDLRQVLRAHVVPDVEAPPNISITVGAESGNTRGFHFLYRGNLSVVRTQSRGRLLRAALVHLDGFSDDPAGTVRLNARLLTDGRSAMVIDATLGSTVDRIERRLELLGYRSVDTAGVVIDRSTLDVVTWLPRLEFDRDALAAAERDDAVSDHREPGVGAARLPIRALVLRRAETDVDSSPSRLLLKLMGLIVSPDRRFVSDDVVVAHRLLETAGVCSCAADGTALLDMLRDRVES